MTLVKYMPLRGHDYEHICVKDLTCLLRAIPPGIYDDFLRSCLP